MGSSNEVDIGTLMGFCSTREKETHDTNKNIMGQLRPIWVVVVSALTILLGIKNSVWNLQIISSGLLGRSVWFVHGVRAKMELVNDELA